MSFVQTTVFTTPSSNGRTDAAVSDDIAALAARIIIGSGGTPESVLTASPGTLCIVTDGSASTMLYIKVTGTGNTGWKVFTAA